MWSDAAANGRRTSVMLVNGTSRMGPSDTQIDDELIVDVGTFLRARYAVPRARGNLRHSVSFDAVWQFADAAQAESAMLQLRSTVPASGILEFQFSGENAGSNWMYNTVLTRVSRKQKGCALYIRFNLAGGEITTQSPVQQTEPM
jgi:hypothetical protein